MRGTSGWRVLVTGGLGFIGSNLARRLAELGADVTIVDSLVAGCGANRFNVRGIAARVIEADIGRPETIRDAIERADVIFNLAGEVSHLDSMLRPERDLEINAATQLRFLDAVAKWRRGVRVVYASTRQVYGIPEYLPVDERHPVRPIDFNGVHKFAATQYHTMLTRQGDLDAIALMLTNVYGPRQSLTAANQGFLGVFMRQALQKQRLKIYGDGSQVRDPLYIDDCVDAFLKAAALRNPALRRMNVGNPEHLPLSAIASVISRQAGLPPPEQIPFPDHLRKIDIGSYFTDSTAFCEATGWAPRVSFEEGAARTLDFYRENLAHYLPATAA
jgi:nucleoside-diphosphate-sugar epimerase